MLQIRNNKENEHKNAADEGEPSALSSPIDYCIRDKVTDKKARYNCIIFATCTTNRLIINSDFFRRGEIIRM